MTLQYMRDYFLSKFDPPAVSVCVLACADFSGSQVFASIEVPPVRQTLYLRGAKLTGASTLRAANVKAGDTLHLEVRTLGGGMRHLWRR